MTADFVTVSKSGVATWEELAPECGLTFPYRWPSIPIPVQAGGSFRS
jgi:hypothetical protein